MGYYDVASGGGGCAPLVPLRCSWTEWYRTPECQCEAQAWLDGFAHGAILAEMNGVRPTDVAVRKLSCDGQCRAPQGHQGREGHQDQQGEVWMPPAPAPDSDIRATPPAEEFPAPVPMPRQYEELPDDDGDVMLDRVPAIDPEPLLPVQDTIPDTDADTPDEDVIEGLNGFDDLDDVESFEDMDEFRESTDEFEEFDDDFGDFEIPEDEFGAVDADRVPLLILADRTHSITAISARGTVTPLLLALRERIPSIERITHFRSSRRTATQS